MPKAIPSAFARYPSFGIKMQRPHLSFSSKHHGTANTISVSPHGIPVRPSPFVYMPKAMPEDTPSICLLRSEPLTYTQSLHPGLLPPQFTYIHHTIIFLYIHHPAFLMVRWCQVCVLHIRFSGEIPTPPLFADPCPLTLHISLTVPYRYLMFLHISICSIGRPVVL